jgi:hypothetical protein
MTSMVGIVDRWLALGLAVGRARWILVHGLLRSRDVFCRLGLRFPGAAPSDAGQWTMRVTGDPFARCCCTVARRCSGS